MNSVIEQMLNQHESTTLSDKKNSIKEVVQEIKIGRASCRERV